MSWALFDKIHRDAYLCERTEPATIEDFVAFGLQPNDYVRYIGLQQRLQSELMLYGFPKSKTVISPEGISRTTYPATEELLSFCKEKHLIAFDEHFHDNFYFESMLRGVDAAYYHGWLQYPMDPAVFRLLAERKLSTWWDEEDAYISETYGSISFDYDEYTESPDGSRWIDPGSPIRVKKYDPDTREFVLLKSTEVKKLFTVAQTEKHRIEKAITTHLSQMPTAQDVAAISSGLPWLRKLYELYDRQVIIDSVFERLNKAAGTRDIYKFLDSDTLFVFCGTDTCVESGHHLLDMRVEFSFYRKPDKQYTIKRCAHCKQFRISLADLISMFDNYGISRGRIVYDNDAGGDFSGFAETSILFEMGYTVNQSVGLSAAARQNILKKAIDTGKVSKHQVLSFLKQRININGMKAGNEIALRKWKEDFTFVSQL